ncbi:MAG: HlyD family efflux transporter periplasmic adaptor subunit [Propioniciclava sp.]|uniref:efflux RND transporter periplasmic adaptor subunit n=1 Tax=Propioniciclava sp. TaxID=2038686 RepID=UPI0039E5FB09
MTDPAPVPSPAPPSRRRLRWWQILLIVVGGVFALIGVAAVVMPLVLFMTMNNGASLPGTQEVAVVRTDLTQSVSLSGTIQPTQRLDLDFSSEGEITDVNVAAGDPVNKGTELASIDDTELRRALTDAKAENDAAWKDYQDARKAGSSAQATAMRSAYNLKAQALKDAQAALDKATLVSTIDGVVAAVNVKPGEMAGGSGGGLGGSGTGRDPAASGGGAAVVVISRTFQVETSVGSAERARIAKGQSATITTSSSATPLRGTVTAVGVVAQAAETTERASAATFAVTIAIDGEPEGVFTGSAATVEIDSEGKRGVLAVPLSALIEHRDTDAQVMVKRGDAIEEVAIKVGITAGEQIEVVSGLEEGDTIVAYEGFDPGSGMPGTGGGGPVRAEPAPARRSRPDERRGTGTWPHPGAAVARGLEDLRPGRRACARPARRRP